MLNSGFKPATKKTAAGDLDWNSVLHSQALSQSRNELIVDLARYFKSRTILILCKRKVQAQIIYAGLRKYGEDAVLYIGTQRYLDCTSRILVVTASKAGVGMDVPTLDMLLLASDVDEGFTQYLGRIFRREHHMPLVVDVIDSLGSLWKHAQTRISVYKEVGGKVKNLEHWFPCFTGWRERYETDLAEIVQEAKDLDE